MPPAANAYLKTKIMTASPAELRLMLLEGAVRFARRAFDGLLAQNNEELYIGVTRTQDILMELLNALKPEHAPQLCARLSGLYTYMYTQLMRASSERDLQKLREVITLLEYERETWSLAMSQLATNANESASAFPAEPGDVRLDTAATESTQRGRGRATPIIGSAFSIQG